MAQGLFTLKQVNQAIRQGAWSAFNPPQFVEYLCVAGGGGGGGVSGDASGGGAGGSGIVIIRYPSYLAPATSTTGSPEMVVSGGWRVYTFVASGTITF